MSMLNNNLSIITLSLLLRRK